MSLELPKEVKSMHDVPMLNLKTTEFREQFPTDDDFLKYIEARNELMMQLDDFAGELSVTLAKCPTCGLFTAMSDFVGIAYVEKYQATSAKELDDNFFGCPDCFLKHLDKHSDKTGRIGF